MSDRIYELTMLIQPKLEEQARKQLIDEVVGMVAVGEDEASKPTISEWGMRTLAYEINDFREAYYVYFEGPMKRDQFREIERQFIYNDDILRYLFVRKDS